MVGFPRLPLIHGETDDDASIHIHRHVGPSQPLRLRDRNRDIESRILEVVEDNTIDDVVSDNMNQLFDLYKQGRLSDYESDDESYVPSDGSTYHELDDEEGFWTGDHHSYQQNNQLNQHEGKNEQQIEYDQEKNEMRKDTYFQELSKNAKESFYRENEEPKQAFQQSTEESRANGQTSTQPNTRKSPKSDLLFLLVLIPLALGVIFTLLYVTSKESLPHNPSIGTINSKIAKLNEITSDISKRQDFLETSQESLSKSINLRFESISERFAKIESSIVGSNQQFADLVTEFTNLRANASGVDEDKLSRINEKLQQFANLESTVESLESHILSQLVAELPQHVPVYIKNKKIHFIPEFHKYLYTFLENYRNGTSGSVQGSWSQFLAENKNSLDSYIEEKLGSSASSPLLKYLTKERLEAILKQKLSENNRFVFSRVNALVDRLDLSQVNGTSFGQATSGIVLSSLLEVFAKGSIKVNYADYTLGARILGFLTRLSMEGSKKSMLRRLFFGWNDYLRGVGTGSGLLVQKPQDWKFNANNAILDNDAGWKCQSHHCSIGIRLFNSVILTDVIVKNKINDESLNSDERINPPLVISLYIKPKNLQQSTKLKEYISKYHLGDEDSGSSNKYLSKFVKIKEVRAKSKLTHIKIPVSLVNLRINTRDIYIEIRGPKGSPVGITNVKAYGITELNAYKYQEELEFLLNQLDTDGQEENANMQDEVSNDLEIDFSDAWQDLSLGDDEII